MSTAAAETAAVGRKAHADVVPGDTGYCSYYNLAFLENMEFHGVVCRVTNTTVTLRDVTRAVQYQERTFPRGDFRYSWESVFS